MSALAVKLLVSVALLVLGTLIAHTAADDLNSDRRFIALLSVNSAVGFALGIVWGWL